MLIEKVHIELLSTRQIGVAVVNAFGKVGTIADSGIQTMFRIVVLKHRLPTRSFEVAL